MAAEAVTPEAMGFFVRHTSGVICAPITAERARALDMPPMVDDNTDAKGTAFTRQRGLRARARRPGISRGRPRRTVRGAGRQHDASRATSRRPGHVFPLR